VAHSKETDSHARISKSVTAVKILEESFGPGCEALFLRGVDPEAAHAFYHQIWVATETLQGKLGPEKTMKFLRKVLSRLNEKLQPTP
jgi:hypothetical protein